MKISKVLAAGLFATTLSMGAPMDNASDSQADYNATEQVKAQKPGLNPGVGIRIAFDYNTMIGLSDEWNNYADNADAPAGIGFEGGLAFRLQLLPFMQFTPEVLFSYTNLKQDDGDCEREFKQTSLQVPVLLRVNPIKGFFLTVGPSFEFNLSDDEHINSGEMKAAGDSYYHEFPEGYEKNSVLFGLTLGAGYNIMDWFYADFRVNLGMSEAYKGESLLISLDDGKLMSFKFGIGFWFM
ncbi:MAG: PorT family protein [Fibrobacter sp.]|nr:PorT family protein [Fibrobacter sp.]